MYERLYQGVNKDLSFKDKLVKVRIELWKFNRNEYLFIAVQEQ